MDKVAGPNVSFIRRFNYNTIYYLSSVAPTFRINGGDRLVLGSSQLGVYVYDPSRGSTSPVTVLCLLRAGDSELSIAGDSVPGSQQFLEGGLTLLDNSTVELNGGSVTITPAPLSLLTLECSLPEILSISVRVIPGMLLAVDIWFSIETFYSEKPVQRLLIREAPN